MGKTLWGGRFTEGPDARLRRFNDSLPFDHRLLPWDVLGSMAHTVMLARQGLIPAADRDALLGGLTEIFNEGRGCLPEDAEDVHSAVENLLAERVGEAAGRLHTGRSRNDQVALDVALYLRASCLELAGAALELARVLVRRARPLAGAPMPGFTHLQRAQVVTIGHHLLAWAEGLTRDAGRLLEAHDGNMLCPLGAGALAGSSLPLDRRLTARLLGFDGVTANSLDTVSDRDGVARVLFECSLTGAHLSRMAEEMILWAGREFGLLRLPDRFCTGSSLMPQKKNPDIPELVRARAGRTMGRLAGFLAVMKALPLAYNKDLQEDKLPLFDAVDTTRDCLEIMAEVWKVADFDRERALELCVGGMSATLLAELLVRSGLPFRQAHHRVGALVARLAAEGRDLEDAGSDEIARALELPSIQAQILTPSGQVEALATEGSARPEKVRTAARELSKRLTLLARSVKRRTVRMPGLDRIRAATDPDASISS